VGIRSKHVAESIERTAAAFECAFVQKHVFVAQWVEGLRCSAVGMLHMAAAIKTAGNPSRCAMLIRKRRYREDQRSSR
jgi:hypothetical protein